MWGYNPVQLDLHWPEAPRLHPHAQHQVQRLMRTPVLLTKLTRLAQP